MFTRARIALGLVLTLFIGFAEAQRPQTPAESVNYQEGGTMYQPLMDFVYGLASQTELMSIQKLTETLGGRDVVLCILSNPPVFRPEDIQKTSKPVVLIVNNVHGEEVAGKDASLEIMRDLVFGDLRPLLDQVVVLNIPTINPDGAEADRRTNEQNFDLNRDYVKLESREIEALVTRVINRWQPEIWVDTHHGGAEPYTLTYQTNMNPGGDSELMQYGSEKILTRVREALRAENYDGFWYSGPAQLNGVDGWAPTSVEPRKQHVYGTFVNSIGLLFESPSSTHRIIDNGSRVVQIPQSQTYRHQVRGQYIGQRELIRFAAQHAAELRKITSDAKVRATERGNNDSDNDQILIDYKQVNKGNDHFWLSIGDASNSGYALVHRPVFTKFEATRTTTRPWGYLIPAGLARIVPLLRKQQVTVKRLVSPTSVEAEVYYAKEVRGDEYFQGHYLRKISAEKRQELVHLPVGTFFVPAGQPRSNLVSYLLEPETDDNLATWGYLDDFLEISSSKSRPQQIPLFRLMKKANLNAVLVDFAE